MKKLRGFKFGFTLAEVLIVISVIGVVAALTIPNLITEYQKRATVESLKKMYSTLQQAAKLYQAENGETIEEFDTSLSQKDFFDKYFVPHLKVSRYCGSVADCWKHGKDPVYMNGKQLDATWGAIRGYILLNGSILAARQVPTGMVFFFDIDGYKGKNVSGHDIFNFYLINTNKVAKDPGCESQIKTLKSGLYPGGYESCWIPFVNFTREQLLGTEKGRTCNKNAWGFGDSVGDACAALIMKDGWTIAKDYPW